MVIIVWLAGCSQWLSGERFPFAVLHFGCGLLGFLFG
jgi:hypothetical protein